MPGFVSSESSTGLSRRTPSWKPSGMTSSAVASPASILRPSVLEPHGLGVQDPAPGRPGEQAAQGRLILIRHQDVGLDRRCPSPLTRPISAPDHEGDPGPDDQRERVGQASPHVLRRGGQQKAHAVFPQLAPGELDEEGLQAGLPQGGLPDLVRRLAVTAAKRSGSLLEAPSAERTRVSASRGHHLGALVPVQRLAHRLRVEPSAQLDDVALAHDAPQLREGPDGDDLAVIDDGQPVAQRLGLFHVVRGVEDAGSRHRLLPDQVQQVRPGSGGPRRRWARRGAAPSAGARCRSRSSGDASCPR